MNANSFSKPRRDFLRASAMISSASLLPGSLSSMINSKSFTPFNKISAEKSVIGAYGSWAKDLADHPPALSFRNEKFQELESWKKIALAKTNELVSSPGKAEKPQIIINKKYTFDGLDIEEVSWQLSYGPATEAILLKPHGIKKKLPGILGLHDHGGNKYFGKRKITKTSNNQHPMMAAHQRDYYEGFAWANELAKRGYVVLVPDSFTFASRRVMFRDMTEIAWGQCATEGMSDANPELQENIDEYNRWAAEHEHILSKSLFCGGTTWPGVFLSEDRVALDVLSERADVDADLLGCAGLSGGGLRTVYLGGLDDRIKCAAAAGFMTTWQDFLMYKAYTHTWMTYAPLLPNYLDFPEILGLRAPLPTMTLNNNVDRLFTLQEMQRADQILKEVFVKAGAPEKYKGNFYDGDHKFDRQMQKDAFDWFDQWLKS